MKGKISIFLPTRKNSERVANKNTRDFAGIKGGLLKIKLEALLNIGSIDQVVLSTNDEESIAVASGFNDPKLNIIRRPDSLCLSETRLSDLIAYVPTIIHNDIIMWVHVTSPFLTHTDYENALSVFLENLESKTADSMASVSKIQEYIWDNEKRNMINFDMSNGNWPRTQDLNPLYQINNGFFISTRETYIQHHNRISPDMAIYELDKIKAFDIDWNDDFRLAEIIYKSMHKL
jgi:CMP-N-acetylneuraminic acid synthetase